MPGLKLFIISALFIYIFALPPLLSAKEKPFLDQKDLKKVNITQYESINPNLLIYPFKRFGENFKLFFIFNKEGQNNFMLELLDTRLKELVYIINFNKTGFIDFSVDRYNTFVGQVKNRSSKPENERVLNYVEVLEKLRDRYHSGSAHWVKIQQAIDTTKTLI